MSDKRITIRIKNENFSQLKNVAKQRGEDISSFIRRSYLKELAELGYLPDDQKKALGLVSEMREKMDSEQIMNSDFEENE